LLVSRACGQDKPSALKGYWAIAYSCFWAWGRGDRLVFTSVDLLSALWWILPRVLRA